MKAYRFSLWGTTLATLGLCLVPGAADEPKPGNKAPAAKHTNRLARETSPYLLLHRHNPVDWFPWGPEAFEKAKKENKLVFLSIGYSSCYWCHVMERQSFNSTDIAKVMNERFVCIKVDREERPDVDSIYMTALQVQGQRGGWPLSMFLTPDGKPIGGGTYWPPEDREIDGQKAFGFKTILTLIHEDWQKNRDALLEHANRVAEAVKTETARAGRRVLLANLDRDLAKGAVASVEDEYDSLHGGFGSKERLFRGPKFPTPSVPELLLADHARTKSPELLKIVTHTLDRMVMGGIYDHLGGGFHRYSVDREWKIPHFEKMLYDNAQLVSLYSRAYQATKKPAYRRVVQETLAFIEREMTAPEGGFYSALDAESEEEEGKFYVWTAEAIDKVLPKADAELIKKVYGVDAGPNFEGKYNALLLPKSLAEAAASMKLTEDQLVARLMPSKQELLKVRAKRPRPLLDTKVLTGWNGLMIAGYADAGTALENPAYVKTAERAAEFVLNNLKSKEGRLLRTWGGGLTDTPGTPPKAKLNAYLEDYAFLVHGLLSLHDATGKKRWLDEAVALTDQMLVHYHDKDGGGFFFTSHDHEKLFARSKDQYDGATPSGNSVAALNLVRLAGTTREARFREQAEGTLKSFSGTLKANPGSMTTMARALALWLDNNEKKTGKPSAAEELFKPDPATKNEDPVRLSATVSPEKPGDDGKQTLTITMEIQKGWHVYANPAGIDSLVPTTVEVTAKSKPEDLKVSYPAAKSMKAPGLDQPALVYEGKAEIKINIRRAVVNGKPDDSPLEVTIRYQACDEVKCLPAKTVKVSVGTGRD